MGWDGMGWVGKNEGRRKKEDRSKKEKEKNRTQKKGRKKKEGGSRERWDEKEQGPSLYILTPDRPPLAAKYLTIFHF